MWRFWHQALRPTFHHLPYSQLSLNFTDTDSFCFTVSYDLKLKPQANFWRDLAKISSWLDPKNFDPETHPFYTENEDKRALLMAQRQTNIQQLGLFKSEVESDERIIEVHGSNAGFYEGYSTVLISHPFLYRCTP